MRVPSICCTDKCGDASLCLDESGSTACVEASGSHRQTMRLLSHSMCTITKGRSLKRNARLRSGVREIPIRKSNKKMRHWATELRQA